METVPAPERRARDSTLRSCVRTESLGGGGQGASHDTPVYGSANTVPVTRGTTRPIVTHQKYSCGQKERAMMRQCIQITLLSGILVVGCVPVVLAQGRGPDVVATITAIA